MTFSLFDSTCLIVKLVKQVAQETRQIIQIVIYYLHDCVLHVPSYAMVMVYTCDSIHQISEDAPFVLVPLDLQLTN
jgi:hypothetical protein